MNSLFYKSVAKQMKGLQLLLTIQLGLIIGIFFVESYYWNEWNKEKILSSNIIVFITLLGIGYAIFFFEYLSKNEYLIDLYYQLGMPYKRIKKAYISIETIRFISMYFVCSAILMTHYYSGVIKDKLVYFGKSLVIMLLIYCVIDFIIIEIFFFLKKEKKIDSFFEDNYH